MIYDDVPCENLDAEQDGRDRPMYPPALVPHFPWVPMGPRAHFPAGKTKACSAKKHILQEDAEGVTMGKPLGFGRDEGRCVPSGAARP